MIAVCLYSEQNPDDFYRIRHELLQNEMCMEVCFFIINNGFEIFFASFRYQLNVILNSKRQITCSKIIVKFTDLRLSNFRRMSITQRRDGKVAFPLSVSLIEKLKDEFFCPSTINSLQVLVFFLLLFSWTYLFLLVEIFCFFSVIQYLLQQTFINNDACSIIAI